MDTRDDVATPRFASLVLLLRHQADARPQQRALIFLPDGEQEAVRLTYRELDRQARVVAADLQKRGLAGHCVLLMLPSSTEYVIAFFGCLYAGAIPVPAYPPSNTKHAQRMAHIVADCRAPAAIVEGTATLGAIKAKFDAILPPDETLALIPIDALVEGDGTSWIAPGPVPEAMGGAAYFQYTSGSTSSPRGVIVTHDNLIQHCASWAELTATDERDVFVTWLPLFHDMGLIQGVIQAIYVGATIVMMPPVAFVQKPLRWLAAFSRYRGTVSYAPNFAYDMCVAATDQALVDTLDLSSWAVAGNGAEPVRADTNKRFIARFEPRGFRASAINPSYGLAEATLVVSCHPRLRSVPDIEVDAEALMHGSLVAPVAGRRSRKLVSCGQTRPGFEVSIVHPETRAVCRDDEVGEIWVKGSIVASGYWQQSEKTAEVFQARLDNGDGPFLRTGDLGAVRDGQLYITGRLKDVIIIRGQNHYPQDIEHTVCSAHPSLAPGRGAAFSIEVDGEERLVVVQEVRRTHHNSSIDGTQAIQAIRTAVAEGHGLQVHAVQLLKPASVHITSSGKIQRQACKKSFLDRASEVLHEWREERTIAVATPETPPSSISHGRSQTAIAAWLAERIARMEGLRVEQVTGDLPFVNLGLDSHKLVALSGDVSTWLGIKVEPMLLYGFPCIDALARHLAGTGEAARSPVPRAMQGQASEAIAVIGIACRFPGANSVDEFWMLLDQGVDPITTIPATRWSAAEHCQPGAPVPGKAYTDQGGFIDGIDEFDAQFFGISPREAHGMDPQQRLLLQSAWHALEDAGIPPDSLAGTDTGVFVGAMGHDYELLSVGQRLAPDAYFGTGNSPAILANRLSYVLDLQGPSWTVETACSSSLVAVHQARASLLQQECGLALVGGINLLLAPDLFAALSQAQMLSPDGRCRTFDARANGYVRSEGCAVLVLKRASDALRDRNRIYGLIAGSAVNQDGRSNGITAPNGEAQKAVMRRALASAGVGPERVGHVEAHGTGTHLGDPIEIEALKQVYGAPSNAQPTLWISSVKSNIGHAEAAAGIAGLIKVLLSLERERIPPNLHFQQLNPNISFEGTRLAIAHRHQPLPRGAQPRMAAVSSFGFGGSNAQVIVAEAPPPPPAPENAEASGRLELLTLSAKTPRALRRLAHEYGRFVAQDTSSAALPRVCHSSQLHRAHLAQRLAVSGRTAGELADALERFAREDSDGSPNLVCTDDAATLHAGPAAFLFTGQGAQYARMGSGLYRADPVFREAMDRCDAVLRPLLGCSLVAGLYGEGEAAAALDLTQTRYAQPALFALGYALAASWQTCGLRPAYVIGHSLGEYVAACVAGVFSLEDALTLVAHRGRLMQLQTPPGAMIAIRAPADTLSAWMVEFVAQPPAGVAIAARNSPSDLVLSGAAPAVEELAARWSAAGATATPLHVTRAFHSPLMVGMLEEFERCARAVRYHPPAIPIASNVSGRIAGAELTDPMYWVEHVTKPVEFMAGMQCLEAVGCQVFVETGPHPVLSAFGRQTLAGGLWLPSMHRGFDDEQEFLASLARWYVAGGRVDWARRAGGEMFPPVQLPAYPFQRDRYWLTLGSTAPASLQGWQADVLHEDARPVATAADTLAALPPAEAKTAILERLLTLAVRVLRMNGGQRAELKAGFGRRVMNQLGFDSLMAIEVRGQIRTQLSADIPLEYFLTGRTADETAALIYQQLAARQLLSNAALEGNPDLEELVI